jgi:alpha-amylase
VYNFSKLSKTEDADLRSVFDDTLVKIEPVNAVVSIMAVFQNETITDIHRLW